VIDELLVFMKISYLHAKHLTYHSHSNNRVYICIRVLHLRSPWGHEILIQINQDIDLNNILLL